jgi:hypothetical protein
MYSSDILNIHKENIMKYRYAGLRRKIEKVTEKFDKLIREHKDLEIKRKQMVSQITHDRKIEKVTEKLDKLIRELKDLEIKRHLSLIHDI